MSNPVGSSSRSSVPFSFFAAAAAAAASTYVEERDDAIEGVDAGIDEAHYGDEEVSATRDLLARRAFKAQLDKEPERVSASEYRGASSASAAAAAPLPLDFEAIEEEERGGLDFFYESVSAGGGSSSGIKRGRQRASEGDLFAESEGSSKEKRARLEAEEATSLLDRLEALPGSLASRVMQYLPLGSSETGAPTARVLGSVSKGLHRHYKQTSPELSINPEIIQRALPPAAIANVFSCLSWGGLGGSSSSQAVLEASCLGRVNRDWNRSYREALKTYCEQVKKTILTPGFWSQSKIPERILLQKRVALLISRHLSYFEGQDRIGAFLCLGWGATGQCMVSKDKQALFRSEDREIGKQVTLIWRSLRDLMKKAVWNLAEVGLENNQEVIAYLAGIKARLLLTSNPGNKKAIVAVLKNNPGLLGLIPAELLMDRSFILELVKIRGGILQFVPHGFLKDAEIVVEAIIQDPAAIDFAMPFQCQITPQKLERIVLKWPKLTSKIGLSSLPLSPELRKTLYAGAGELILLDDPAMQDDIDLVLIALQNNPSIFGRLKEDIRRNELVWKIALSLDGMLIAFLKDQTVEMAKIALKQNGKAYGSLSLSLRDDEEVARIAARCGAGIVMLAASDRLKAKRSIALTSLRYFPITRPLDWGLSSRHYQDGVEMHSLAGFDTILAGYSAFADDTEIAQLACRIHPSNIFRASKRLRNDKDFMLYVCQGRNDWSWIWTAGKAILDDRVFITDFIVAHPLALEIKVPLTLDFETQNKYAALAKDRAFRIDLYARNPNTLTELPENWYYDKDFCRAIFSLKMDHSHFITEAKRRGRFLERAAAKDKAFMEELIRLYRPAIALAHHSLREDGEWAFPLVTDNPDATAVVHAAMVKRAKIG